ncbi:intraflagellar transport protein 57 homolog [Physella acuta]|uniref:intraflagellar transport protein 57 homolog n=1 Tax=Physella acuta TaxID=109671 RepID=UPI0027DE3776|nr:intraflagellar transport protein 57 homolog [Physella acuta]
MSEDKRRGGGDEVEDGGPGLIYMPFVIMEELLEKLRLLDYEKDFSKKMNLKPITRHYFAIQTNPGEQFYMFTSLAAWLLNKAGRPFDQPQEYDDPNATISSILDELRKYGHTVDFPPSKLKQGWGEHCIYILDRLADEALKSTNFVWKRPTYPEEETEEENIVEDDSELNLNEIEKSMVLGSSDVEEADEDEPLLDLEGMKMLNQNKQTFESSKPEEILESTTDAADWKLEVERVMPQLKVTIRTDNKDWRVHLEQMHQHHDGIKSSLNESKVHLDKLQEEISKTLEKISSREKYINSQLEHLLVDFRQAQDALAETKEKYRQASGGVTERSRTLAEITEELEKIKQEMDEKGTSMTDGSILAKIKQAILTIKKECTQMDIRAGVVEHILLQAKLKDKTLQNKQIHSSGATEGFII